MRKLIVHDLSLEISSSLPYYPGDPEIKIEPKLVYAEKNANVLSLHLGTHSGTHIDTPLHQIDMGRTLEDIRLDIYMGEAVFLHIPKDTKEAITPDDLKRYKIREGDIVIICTGWEEKKYQDDYFIGFPYFAEEAADFLISRKVKCIGSDIPSVDKPGSGAVFHKKILSQDIGIVEALINLKPLTGKRMFFSALPLAIKNGDGSPVRAVAVEGI